MVDDAYGRSAVDATRYKDNTDLNITAGLRRVARDRPNATALIFPDRRHITHGELDRRIDCFAARMLALGYRAGQIAGLSTGGPDEALALVMALALARIGIASADPSVRPDCLAVMLVQAGPSFGRQNGIDSTEAERSGDDHTERSGDDHTEQSTPRRLNAERRPTAEPGRNDQAGDDPTSTDHAWGDRQTTAPGARAPVISFDWSWGAPSPDAAMAPVALYSHPTAIFRLYPTSGTTTAPRHCVLTHAAIVAELAADAAATLDKAVAPITLCAIGGHPALRGAVTALGAGGSVVFTHISRVANAILKHNVTLLLTSPFVLRQILSTLPDCIGPLPSLRAVVTMGSILPSGLAAQAARVLCRRVLTYYGATECGAVAIGPPTGTSAGTLLPGVQAQTVDDAGRPLHPGHAGLLGFRTPGLFAGYWHDPEATAAKMRDGWFYPGDIGVVTADRRLILHGRSNEIINTGGLKISPRAVEAALLNFPGVIEAAAFGVPDGEGLTHAWAAVVGEAPLPIAALMQFARERLGISAPRHLLQITALPRNANGKVLTDALVLFALRRTGTGPLGPQPVTATRPNG